MCDVVCLSNESQSQQLISTSSIGISLFVNSTVYSKRISLRSFQNDRFPFSGVDEAWRWERLGFQVGEATYSCGLHGHAFWVLTAPHWSFILPLTLLSARLLLCNPLKPKSAPSLDRIATTGH